MAQTFRRQANRAAGWDFVAPLKMRRVFTRRQWLNGRFSEGGLSHDDGRTTSMGPYFARVLLKR